MTELRPMHPVRIVIIIAIIVLCVGLVRGITIALMGTTDAVVSTTASPAEPQALPDK
jgi:hypothetical protein